MICSEWVSKKKKDRKGELPRQLIYRVFKKMLLLFLLSDVPTQMPPLTPGTNKKLSEALKASFSSWEKEVQNRNITKGNLHPFLSHFNISILSYASCTNLTCEILIGYVSNLCSSIFLSLPHLSIIHPTAVKDSEWRERQITTLILIWHYIIWYY